MLQKTMTILANIPPGTHLPEGEDCFDEDEIAQIGQLLARLVYAPSGLRKKLQSYGVTLTRSDFYSEIPTIEDLEQSASRARPLKLDGLFPAPAIMRAFLTELDGYAADFRPPMVSDDPHRFAWQNGSFTFSDALAYYAMIRRYRPRTVLELGSGMSTLVAMEALKANGEGRLICVEPFPSDMLRMLPGITLMTHKAQELDDDFLNRHLTAGDILFIDTTHTVRHESDCLHIYLRLLPKLTCATYVHAHDIFLPDGLPLHLMRDHQIFWNEQYLLYALLLENPDTRILYGSAWHTRHNRQGLEAFMRGRFAPGGASFWFSRTPGKPG
ncbi:class I SAM-dependent methyltransferase [Rhodovarius crocodyli]|uniref:Class I SAM-dependent methyltransferase n=1 Tax=Rhodovarius crocodyli TaxID=1979269 RepID=A0A437ME64_9PROT|nr:class I SAM-dependent methyltransferase [Rhodovarius crocodyli]RVT95916.1 class I SAM-dependent methyltransferase [Rhodovarius crocodyli]